MIQLLRLVTFRHLLSEKTRTLLTLTGIALGVALFLSVRLANESILHSFRNTIAAVAGKTSLQVTRGSVGLDEALLEIIRGDPGVKAVAPILQSITSIEGVDEPVMLLGVDPFSEPPFREYTYLGERETRQELLDDLLDPQTIFVSEHFALSHGLSVGSHVRIRANDQVHDFTVRSLLKFEGATRALQGNFALLDIATYQWRLDRVGRLDRIDLIVKEGVDVDHLAQRLSTQMPSDIMITRPEQRGMRVEAMLSAFQLNLTALSAITLLVALFLMYNTMTMAVVRRRAEIGMLRSLGVSARSILLLFLLESGLLGLVGGLAGVPSGWFLAQWTVGAMGQTVTTLYTPVIVREVILNPYHLIEGLGLGVSVCLLAGLASVREANRIVPREALQRSSYEAAKSSRYGKTALLGILFLLLALALARSNPFSLPFLNHTTAHVPVLGYASALFLLLAFSCLAPLTIFLFHVLIHRLPTRWTFTELKLASNNLVSTLGRSSMAVTAIVIGLAMMGGMMIMIKSFRTTVELWIDQTIRADLFIIPSARTIPGVEATFPIEVLGRTEGIKGIEAVEAAQSHLTYLGSEEIIIAGRDFGLMKTHGNLLVLNGNTQDVLQNAQANGAILVSEPLAYRHGIQPGQALDIPTPRGKETFQVAGVFYDYTTDGGRILIDQNIFRRYWSDDRISTLAVYLSPTEDLESVREAILDHLGENHQITVIANRELRNDILDIFDQTFTITYALELITVLAAILGVINTLVTALLERKRELAILRVLGCTQAQMRKIILSEAFLIAAAGIALGLAGSLLLSQVLINVINKQSFGWTILFWPSWFHLLQAALFVLLAALMSAYFPARRASQIRLTEALQYE